ncbi:DUF5693 family protein [Paenibacillus tarimensis]|uniref:DUF5693 family protein n=1 Tax=Paenibacillus tarimensis TaxID=416012 RepID=UPI001F2CC059|nr:DUF5693 family protein [Paenibacillus tarimensis]MCF2944148.1 DUF5693 family protein [Paenibacillus tarimensis]
MLKNWNRRARTLLWGLTILGVLAALPIGFSRHQMEQTSNHVEYVFNYRDLLLISNYQARPQEFVSEQLARLKEAGFTTLAVFESTLEELVWSGRLSVYNSAQQALLNGETAPLGENFTYILFADADAEAAYAPMIRSAFEKAGISVGDWSFGERPGLRLETSVENSSLRSMQPDPVAIDKILEAGFHVLPRLSDRIRPYDPEEMSQLLQSYADLGIARILFDGDKVTGYTDQADKKSLNHFGELLKQHNIGLVRIENLKNPQSGMNKLAYMTNYNITRLYSLSSSDASVMTPEAIIDRFKLAAKDRNIRMFYMNASPARSLDKGGITHPMENLYLAIGGDAEKKGAVEQLKELGFEPGPAQPFDYEYPSWHKVLRAIVALGAIAIIALLIGLFIPILTLPAFILGVIGSAGLYVLSTSLLEQALALGASIAAPTIGVIWALSRVRSHTEGDRRIVGGTWEEQPSLAADRSDRLFGGRWLFDAPSFGKRLVSAISLYILTAVISLLGAAYVFGLLNNITYSLVLEQFRGVSLLHLAPIGLTALYVFLYTGHSVKDNLRKLLGLNITVLMVAVAGVLGVVGMYYLSRTGNAGQVSSIELVFRNLLEETFGVRPRNKEFMLAHPVFLLGLFLSLRYRAAWVLMIVASIGQLSMVDTFAHIHTPIAISLIRVLLGLGLGGIIGLLLIAAWQLAEGVWKAWAPKFKAGRTG